jgi:hypothetical protein
MRTYDLRAGTNKMALASSQKLNKSLNKIEKCNSKRMANENLFYTVNPLKYTPEQIFNPGEGEKKLKGKF